MELVFVSGRQIRPIRFVVSKAGTAFSECGKLHLPLSFYNRIHLDSCPSRVSASYRLL